MTRIYRLEPITIHDRPLTFAWNREAGTFAGPDGAYVTELAAILGQYWRLPLELIETCRYRWSSDQAYRIPAVLPRLNWERPTGGNEDRGT